MKTFAVAVSCFALAACGGESSSSPPVGIVPAPVPVATSAPTPSPTTSAPASAGSPSYAAAFDFSIDRGFFAFGSEFREVGRYETAALSSFKATTKIARLLPSDNAALFEYTALSQSLKVNFDRDVSSFASSDNQSRSDQFLTYYNVARQDSVKIVRPSPSYSHVLSSRQELERRQPDGAIEKLTRFAIIGVPTLASDLPVAGVSDYPVIVSSSPASGNSPSGFVASGSLKVDHVGGTVSGILTATELTPSGVTGVRATLTFSGTLSPATGLVKGSIASTDSGFSGDFSGRVFGPRAGEIGAAFAISRDDGTRVVGKVVGRRG